MPQAEICDGTDNDCDDQTDEGLLNACGACGSVPVEVCNGRDDDCNGVIDNGVLNACGKCGELPIEICDGTDNDCDGRIDEGFDSDNDGTADCNDGCINDPMKIDQGICGCGAADTDTDNDGTPNCNDSCSDDPNKIAAGICGCGAADTDNDNDGLADCNDVCPGTPSGGTVDGNGCSGEALPPDPATIAPPVDQTVATDIASATSFLYTGLNPIQTGVAPATIETKRAAVLRGKVMDINNNPLPGVTISVLSHPEFGQTLSRADGMFDMAVNGGGDTDR